MSVTYTVDELAREAGMPVRTIREYQTIGVLPGPQRRGRVGEYRSSHLHRLSTIARLQERGYSLAGIRDLLESWEDGGDLGAVLGLEPDQLVHVDEPGAPTTLPDLEAILPSLIPARIDELIEAGVLIPLDGERWCVPSPSLLQLAVDLTGAGIPDDAVVHLLTTIGAAARSVADVAVELIDGSRQHLKKRDLDRLLQRGRGLISHGVGRLTIQSIGERI